MDWERSRRLGMMKGVFHVPSKTWSKFKPMGSLKRWLCHVKVEKFAAEKIGRLIFLTWCRQHSIWEEVSKNELASQGFSLLGQDLEIDTDKKPNKKGLFYATLKNLLKVGRPTTEFSKGPNLVGQPTFEVLIGTRACGGLPNLGSSPPALNLTEFTNEALVEEASKYIISYSRSLFSLGKRDFSSSSTILSGWDGVIVATDGSCGWGCSSETIGRANLGPLRMILVDRRKAEVSGLAGMANGAIEEEIEDVSKRVFQEVMEERNATGESCWQFSCLAKF
ncbi:hypothetical protein AAG906_033374 [Vitis piasezkii]